MSNVLIVEDFPKLNAAAAASKSVWGQKSLDQVLEIINTYADEATIPNPEFKKAKEALNTIVDLASGFNGLYQEVFSAAYSFPKSENYTFDLGYMYANQVAGKVKLATKKKFDNAEWFEISNEIVTIYDALMAMKGKIVKRRARSEEELADDYVPPMPTTEAAVKVLDILKTMTDALTKQYASKLFEQYRSGVEVRFASPKVRGDKNYLPCFADLLLNKVGDKYDSFNGNYTSLKSNWLVLLKQEADHDADYVQRMFLYKNVTKLAMILEAKGDFTSRIIEGCVNGAGFQGEIVFYFADDTEFTVRNKVIVNISVHGKAFNQFPTTFHNVTGIKGQPSQEEMIEQFAGVKAGEGK